MMKAASGTEIKDETRNKGQFAKSVKTKNAHFCGQGTDSQQDVKAEEDEWLESRKVQRTKVAMKETHKSQRRRKVVLTFWLWDKRNVFLPVFPLSHY